MTIHNTKWLLVGLVCLALWPAHASAQGKDAQSGAESVTGSDPAAGPDPDCLNRYRWQPHLRKEKCATPAPGSASPVERREGDGGNGGGNGGGNDGGGGGGY